MNVLGTRIAKDLVAVVVVNVMRERLTELTSRVLVCANTMYHSVSIQRANKQVLWVFLVNFLIYSTGNCFLQCVHID